LKYLFVQWLDEYCVDATSKIVSTRVENYCDSGSNGCDKYFTCVAGVCTDTTDDRDSMY